MSPLTVRSIRPITGTSPTFTEFFRRRYAKDSLCEVVGLLQESPEATTQRR